MFFGQEYRWKVFDVDLGVFADCPMEVYETSRNTAPEIILAKDQGKREIVVKTSADMWSFGIILFEVLSGQSSSRFSV